MESAYPLTPQRSQSFPEIFLQTLRGLGYPCASNPTPMCTLPYTSAKTFTSSDHLQGYRSTSPHLALNNGNPYSRELVVYNHDHTCHHPLA